ncbi:MAG: RIP metalloprotease RseP [Alphaproteobacteria bacterium]
MAFLDAIWTYVVPFLVVLTVLVFVHELGHYLVARRNGVRVEVFSIGFGRELFGFTDRAGTRWKFSAIPLGGYVKMFGDANAASMPGDELPGLTEDEKAESFHHKRLGQRVAIVAAGPIANFLFAMVALAFLFATAGHPFDPPPWVGAVTPGSPAEAAGILPGDTIVAIDGQPVGRFGDLVGLVQSGDGAPISVDLRHDGTTVTLTLTPQMTTVTNADGVDVQVPRIGVVVDSGPYGLLRSVRLGVTETVWWTAFTLRTLGEIIVGDRGREDLGGPIMIAQISGQVAQIGWVATVWFMAVLSINLGLINLFPVPMLDGGHLLYYAAEAVRGRPLGERAQEYGFRIGLVLVLTLMVFATWNDLERLQVVAFLKELIF